MRAEIPGYSIGELVGSGGFSSVYRAKQDQFDREVALKLLSVRLDEPGAVRRFQNECLVLGRLDSHPHVADVFAAGTGAENQPFIAMRLYQRGSLADALADQGFLPISDVLSLGIQIAGALQAAHDLGVVHRDVKPQNILLTDHGDAALADFGVAIITQGANTTVSQAFTYDYAAPEILESEEFSPASDQYALASTLYTLATGQVPFPGSAPASKIRAICTSEPDLTGPRLSPIADVLAVALAKNPADRYPTTGAFAAALVAAKTAEDAAIAKRKRDNVHTVAPTARVRLARAATTSPAGARRSPARTDPVVPTEPVKRRVGSRAASLTAAAITIVVAVASVSGQYAIYATTGGKPDGNADWLIFMGSLFVVTAVLGGWLIVFSKRFAAIGYGIALFVLVSRFKRDSGTFQRSMAQERPGAIVGSVVLVLLSVLALWLVARYASRGWVRSTSTRWQTAAIWALSLVVVATVSHGYWAWSQKVPDVAKFGQITLVGALTLTASFVAIYVASRLPNGLGLLGYVGAFFVLHGVFMLATLLELTTDPSPVWYELGLLVALGIGLVLAVVHVRIVWGNPAVDDTSERLAPSVVDLRYKASPTVRLDLTDTDGQGSPDRTDDPSAATVRVSPPRESESDER